VTAALYADRSTAFSLTSDRAIREQLDRCVSRALFDREYARRLMADPTIAIADFGCPPQQFKLLRTIRATNLLDFARQARMLFWREDDAAWRNERLRRAAQP
jgi:hypothetical protein